MSSEETLTQADVQAVLETDALTGGIDIALFDLYNNNASSGKALNNECYSAQYSDTGYIATFNNCALNGTTNISGTLTVTYSSSGEQGAFTASYEGFSIGNHVINGTRTYNVSADQDSGAIHIETVSDLSIIMADGSTISDAGSRSWTLTFGDSAETTTVSVGGTWTVVYEGNTYEVKVNAPLTSNFSCGYITSGAMTVSKNGLTVDVAFGDGTCDDVAKITYPNGVEEEITLRD